MKLTGKKTYLVTVVLAVVTLARLMGWMNAQTFETLLGLLGALGLGTLRAGVAKLNPNAPGLEKESK